MAAAASGSQAPTEPPAIPPPTADPPTTASPPAPAPPPDTPLPPPHAAAPLAVLDRAEFECALCMKLFWEPLALHCGHTFCRSCIKRSLEMQAACPLCRGACRLNASEVRPNLLITKVIAERFASELADRAREAAADEDELNRQRLGLFLLPDTGGRLFLFPGAPITLRVWEPRYLTLIQQCLENRAEFGIQPDAGTMFGAAMRIVDAGPGHGRGPSLIVRAVVHSRYRCLTRPVLPEGDFGLVVAPLVEYIEDAPLEDGAAAGDAEAVSALLDSLPVAAQRALRGASRGAQAQALVGACAATVVRLLASVGGRAEALMAEHGPHPPPTASVAGGGAQRWSFYLADVLALPLEATLRCFNTASTLERLLICYAFLAAEEEAVVAAAAASGAVPRAPAEAAAAAAPPLAPFQHVAAERAMRFFRPLHARPPLNLRNLSHVLAAAASSPLVSSLAVFVFVFGLLWLIVTGRIDV